PVPVLDPRAILTMADMGHGGHAGHDMPAAMDHADMDHGTSGQPPMDHAAMGHAGMAGMDHAAMGHSAPGAGTMITHPASENDNPAVDMQTMAPSRALDDVGIGLRGNGRRVLTYADLKSTF